ncbi:hypothetical protein N8823_02685 [Candidatus Pseudothioglobus singularis]|nr:hypothetical protein [Candidatus Pseudothioglobus singularis]
MKYNYSFPDFMKYAIESGLVLREEGEVLWVQTKPLPTELVRDIFFDAPRHISTFLNHTLSAVIAALGQLKYNAIDVKQSIPSDKLSQQELKQLKSYFDEFSTLEEYKKFQKAIIFLSGINYQGLTKELFIESISHGGKKYDRLYYPDSIKKIISENFPRVQDVLSRNPKDFFGNILCDDRNIYRSGYNDALAYIFNKYFDFKFDVLPNYNPNSSLHGQDKSIDVVNKGSLIFTKSLRGNLWEPELYHNGKVNTKIDKNHVFNEVADDKKYEILLLALAKQELDIFDPNVKEIFENYRFRVSKEISNFVNK